MKSLVRSGQVPRFVAVASLALLGAAPGAWAQTAAPAPASNVPTFGPPLPGVCVFARDTALGTSQAGVSVNQQLQQMAQGVQSNLNPERDAIAKDSQALDAEKAKLAAPIYQKREQALQQRAQTYSQTVQARSAQFQATRDKAMDRIAAALTPLLVSSITDHKCSLIVERRDIYGANPAMDLTPEVIGKLNVAMPTLTVTLEPQAAPRPAG